MRHIVGLALVFEERNTRDIERFGKPARAVVHRNAREIALDVARNAVALIFVVTARPFPRDADLGRCRRTHQQQQHQEYATR